MKFLEIPELDVLSRALNLSTPTFRVNTRIEAYSCKAVAREKKLFKVLESELIQDLSHSTSVSPPDQHPGLLESAFGPLDQRASRKTLWLLIGLLNVAYPDHDFSQVRPEEFRREEGPRAVLASLSAALDQLRSPIGQRGFSSYPPSSAFPLSSSEPSSSALLSSTPPFDDSVPTNPFLRAVLDPVIDLEDCEVFSYTPDMDSDPHAAESDDESDGESDSGAYERDDDGGFAWEMDGVDAGSRATSGPSWEGGYGTPMKSFSAFLAPGTPTAEDWSADSRGSGSLLWSSHYFLFNKRKKRIVFVSIWGSSRRSVANGRTAFAGGPMSRLKRRASTTSLASLSLDHEPKKTRA